MSKSADLLQVNLDERCLPYLERLLRAGGDLSAVILDRLSGSPSRIWTLLPAEGTADEAYMFGDAVISRGEANAASIERAGAVFEALVGTVERHLRSATDAVCLLEHVWGSPTDGWIGPFDFVSQDEGVLVFLTHDTVPPPGEEPALGRIVRTSTMYYLCVLVRDPEWPTWLSRGRSVSRAHLGDLTRGEVTAITRAYDDEGYIYIEFG